MHNPTPLETVMRLKELDRQATPKLIPMRARRQGASPVAALWATMITLLRRLRAVGIPGRVASEQAFIFPVKKHSRDLHRRPGSSASCQHLASCQLSGDLAKTCDACSLDLGDDRPEIGRASLRDGLLSLGACLPGVSAEMNASEAAEIYAASLGAFQRCLGPGADHLAIAFSDHGYDADNHVVSFRHVGSDELDARLHKPRRKCASRG